MYYGAFICEQLFVSLLSSCYGVIAEWCYYFYCYYLNDVDAVVSFDKVDVIIVVIVIDIC